MHILSKQMANVHITRISYFAISRIKWKAKKYHTGTTRISNTGNISKIQQKNGRNRQLVDTPNTQIYDSPHSLHLKKTRVFSLFFCMQIASQHHKLCMPQFPTYMRNGTSVWVWTLIASFNSIQWSCCWPMLILVL